MNTTTRAFITTLVVSLAVGTGLAAPSFATASLAAPSRAQIADTTDAWVGPDGGFFLGFRVATSYLRITDDPDDDFSVKKTGVGVEIFTGFGFNPIFSLQLELVGVGHKTSHPDVGASFGGLQLFAHYRARPGRALRPYLKGGIGSFILRVSDGTDYVQVAGPGIPVGGGFDYFFNRNVALGVDVTHRVIQWDRVEFDIDGENTSVTIKEGAGQTAASINFRVHF